MSLERSARIAIVAIGLASLLLIYAIGAERGSSGLLPTAAPVIDAPTDAAIYPIPERPARRVARKSIESPTTAPETTASSSTPERPGTDALSVAVAPAEPVVQAAADSAADDCAGQLGHNFGPCAEQPSGANAAASSGDK